jgi:hypothetical protein
MPTHGLFPINMVSPICASSRLPLVFTLTTTMLEGDGLYQGLGLGLGFEVGVEGGGDALSMQRLNPVYPGVMPRCSWLSPHAAG